MRLAVYEGGCVCVGGGVERKCERVFVRRICVKVAVCQCRCAPVQRRCT